MQMQITGRHVEVTDSLKQYVEEKVNKVAKYFDNITHAKVVLDVEREKHQVEVLLNLPGQDIVAKADHTDMYAAVDLVEEKLETQVKKYKQKMKNHHDAHKHERFDEVETQDI